MQDATRMPSLPKAVDDEDEIDLRQYLEALIAWRWEIVAPPIAAALLAMGGVLALRLMQPPVYKATATVVIARTSSNINFDDTFRSSPACRRANRRRSRLCSMQSWRRSGR
ncbi:MAG: Wzz/FepE/Etk N-terminal domain-containing protein [Caldilinea sp.]|nr:Wzz/FepE/Etk N-terminal domain-containing protein [Caldilinea sp.]MDW8440887.1 Wzz/FepE/Etk N-terminal domain-containing protein [Caldilineaceae bacterium]